MQIVITTPPAPLLTHDDPIVRQSLALDGIDRDEQADMLLLAAQAELDGPNGKLGFSVAEQSVVATVETFDDPIIRLPGGPIIADSVVVTYLDGSGDGQTLDDTTYLVAADGVLTLVSGGAWPPVAEQGDAISVAYDVGIADETDPRVAQMKTAIIAHAQANLDPPEDGGEAARKAVTSLTSTLWVPVM